MILKIDSKQMEAYAGIAQAFEKMDKKEDAASLSGTGIDHCRKRI